MRPWLSACAGLLVALALVATPLPAAASCAEATPAELFALADVVFFGRVVEQTHPVRQGGTDSRFEVVRVLKGQLGPGLTVWETTGPAPFPNGWLGQGMGSSVDVGYRLGQSYIVFAQQSEKGWVSGTCSGTRELAALTPGQLEQTGFGELSRHLPGAAPDPSLRDAGQAANDLGVSAVSRSGWWVVIVALLTLFCTAGITRRYMMRRAKGLSRSGG